MASSSVNANLAPSPVVGSPAIRQPESLPSPLPLPLPLQQSPHTPSPLLPYQTPVYSLSMEASPSVATNTSKDLELALNRYSSVALRALAFLFSFSSSLAMVVPSGGEEESLIFKHPQLTYCMVVVILSSVYSAVQFLKGMWDELAYKGFVVSTKIFDYFNFFLDQMMAYLLFSSSTLAVSETGRTTFHSAIIALIVLSFSAFVAMAASAVRSGYQLSKRISW